jgi:hypothetical protein
VRPPAHRSGGRAGPGANRRGTWPTALLRAVNASLAHPREIFRPAITHSAFAFVLVHNHPSGAAKPSEADLRITKRVASGARILQINFLDHVIVGQAVAGRLGYFQFPGSWDDLIDEPLLAEQTLTIRGFELLLIVE